MYSNNLAKLIQEVLTLDDVKTYHVDNVPPFDSAKNYTGFIAWDTNDPTPMHNSEFVLSSNDKQVLNFELYVSIFAASLSDRNTIEQAVLAIMAPFVNGRRVVLQQRQFDNGFVRSMVWLNTSEYPIPKTAQSNAELSATVLTFQSSVTI